MYSKIVKMNGLLNKILTSAKIHLTFSEKNFVKESFEVLSIFEPNLENIFHEMFINAVSCASNKFEAGKKFVEYIYFLRYPISYPKIKKLKRYKIGLTLEFDETKLNLSKKEAENIKRVLNQI